MALGWCWTLALLGVAVFAVYEVLRRVLVVKGEGRAVFITGCDTGFGNALAKRLDALGFHVLAGCLTAQGVSELGETLSSRSRAFPLDVTSDESVAAAVETAGKALDAAGLKGLYAVVNNAGILDGLAVEMTPLAVYRRVMEVNFFGLVRVTKGLLSQVQRARGRVLNVTSIAGQIVAPGFSVYSAAKYAAEAFTDGLRREQIAFGVAVSLIEPGFMKTPIVMNANAALTRLWNGTSQDVKDAYGADWEGKLQELMRGVQKDVAQDPEIVVKALVNAVTTRLPRDRYVLGTSGIGLRYVAMLPTFISDQILLKLWVQPANAAKASA